MPKHHKMPNLMFRGMSMWITFRSIKRKPMQTLQALGVKKGQNILDYGAGPGAFSIPAAEIVELDGSVVAVDIHPLSKKIIERKAKKKELSNVKVILANINTGIDPESMDIVLLFDVIHSINEKRRLLKELHRVLKTGGKILIRPDHMPNEELKELIKSDGMFKFNLIYENILEFHKIG